MQTTTPTSSTELNLLIQEASQLPENAPIVFENTQEEEATEVFLRCNRDSVMQALRTLGAMSSELKELLARPDKEVGATRFGSTSIGDMCREFTNTILDTFRRTGLYGASGNCAAMYGWSNHYGVYGTNGLLVRIQKPTDPAVRNYLAKGAEANGFSQFRTNAMKNTIKKFTPSSATETPVRPEEAEAYEEALEEAHAENGLIIDWPVVPTGRLTIEPQAVVHPAPEVQPARFADQAPF